MAKKPRLCYFSAEPGRQGYASYTHINEIINNLRKIGWSVDLYSPQYNSNKLPGAIARLIGISKTIFKVILAPRPDLYYLRWHFATFPIALWAKVIDLPIVIEVNGPVDDLFIAWPGTRYFRRLFEWLMIIQLKWARLIIAVTDGLAKMSCTLVGHNKNIAIISNGANTELFSPDAVKLENEYTQNLPDNYFIFFGTMAQWQGIRSVLKAIECPSWPPDVALVFAGDGVEYNAIKMAAKRLSNVHYLGRVPYNYLPSVIARAKGSFVCTENLEGRGETGLAPLKLFESMACGIPVIVTDLPFQADIVREIKCGYVVPVKNPEEIASAAAKIVADEDVRKRMSERAREAMVAKHSWEVRARETHGLLLDILNINEKNP